MITERPLTGDELAELQEAAASLELEDLDALDALVDAARSGDIDDELIFHLGAWFGERARGITGWVWVNVRFGEGLETPALVPEDRSVAILPLQLASAVLEGAHDVALRAILERLEGGARPRGDPQTYAIVG